MKSTSALAAYCPSSVPSAPVTGSSGSGKVFKSDPLVSSGNASLSPASSSLGNFATTVTLSNLNGTGVLKGTFANVVTDRCGTSYGAFSRTNSFGYEASDERFSEVMNYYHGNAFRSDLNLSSALYPSGSFLMIANCDVTDNAYYTQGYDGSGNLVDYVCIGRSSKYTATTDFSDDAQVIVHELQHATTGNAYSTAEDFNKLNYDEAGAINEALSDFMALMQFDSEISSPFKNFEFSRWALGLFFNQSLLRGAAKCPAWTPDYPTCSNFSKTSTGFSESAKRISFAYPDGLGWPYAGPANGATLRSVWRSSTGFEQIHQTSPIVTGALFDVYEAIKASSGNATTTRQRLQRLIMESIKTLPKASSVDPSPVTMPVLASKIIAMAATTTAGTFSGAEQTAISNALSARGLTGIPTVADGWASVGSNGVNHTGIYFLESTPVGTANYRMRAGEKGRIWFNIANSSSNTAAAPLLKVTSSDSRVRFTNDQNKNPGYVSSTVAFVRYGKINGSSIVTQLNNGTPPTTGITNSYFGGSELLGINSDTALYIEIDSSAPSGLNFTFNVEIAPANKATSNAILNFPVTLQ